MPEVHFSDLKSPGEMAKMYQDAIIALESSGGAGRAAIQSYTLPTGVTVSRADIQSLRDSYEYRRKLAHRADYGMTTVLNQAGAL